MKSKKKYRFSFTATSLRTLEFVEVAKWEDFDDTTELELSIGNGKSNTGKRMLSELVRWRDVLTPDQLELLINGSRETQNKIAFLAVCKCYDFIREFVIEVVREKFMFYDYVISDGDYLTFFRSKSYQFEELEDLTDLTQAKIKQVIFKMLEQAGIIDSVITRNILPQILDDKLIKVISSEDKEYLKFFLYSDSDIELLT